MTTGRAGVLLRRPEQARPAFLELFFDLAFVLVFFQLSQYLLEHLSWTGVFQTLVLLFAVMHLWSATTRFLDAFDPRHPLVQLLIMPIILGTLVLAAVTPEAFGRNGLVFAGVYLTIRLVGLAMAVFFLHGHEAQASAVRRWIPVILGGPALFLAGRAIFEYAVFGRVSLPRVIGALALVALTPAMRPVPPLAVATAAALVLAGVAVADAARTRRLPSERPSPPG